jgi:hypothetical protein
VRIGIVMVLTAMVFLGNYAYQHYVGLLGPLGKVVLLYAASAGLLAAGKILPRKQERLKNYGQVLFAGGLAAVYFTTYAAYHFQNLRVISSPILDGVLLLAWTAYIVWLADRKKSEVLAVFAIGLAYYTALITNVGNFTLISNLFLAIAAVFFLVRNRWVTLTFLSIAASYGSFFYWRYYTNDGGIDEFAGRLSICGYWTIFTAAVFLSRHTEFWGRRRASFLSFNNGAAFTLLTFSFLHQHSGRFWQFSLAAGGILLGLALAASRFIREDELPRRAYLAQGILLVTLGIISKLSGPTLALVLAVESALLVIFATQWKSRLLHAAGVIVGALSAGWMLLNLHPGAPGGWAKAAAVFALLLFDAIWTGKHDPEKETSNSLRRLPGYFTVLSLVTWCGATFLLAEPLQIAPILALTALSLTAMHYLLRVREITLLSQALLPLAQGQLLMLLADQRIGPSWSPILVIAISMAMSIWWRREKVVELETVGKRFLEILYALAAAAITQLYLPNAVAAEHAITASWMLTFAWTALGLFTRSWPIAAAGQLFVIAASFSRITHFIAGGPDVLRPTLEIIAALIALAAMAHHLAKRFTETKPLQFVPVAYQWLATVLVFLSVRYHVTPERQFITFVTLFAASVAATMAGARYAFLPGLALAGAGVLLWVTSPFSQPQDLIAILMLAGTQIFLRRKPAVYDVADSAHAGWIAAVSALVWMFLSRWVIAHSAGQHFYLTASWAILAFVLFGVGFALRERTYRWAALTVLACALARVVMLDVWRLETLYRIFSFLALGIVLLVLGYFYTRFQEKIAKWL